MPSIISPSTTKNTVSVFNFLKGFAPEHPEHNVSVRAHIKAIVPSELLGEDSKVTKKVPQPSSEEISSKALVGKSEGNGDGFVARSLKSVLSNTVEVLGERLHEPVHGRRPLVVPVPPTSPQPQPETDKKLSSFQLRNQKLEEFMLTPAYAALDNSSKLIAQASVDFWKTMKNRFVEAVDRVGDYRQKGASHAI